MDHEKGNTLKVYIKQYLNRYKGCFALVAGIMIFYIFTLYLCGVFAADIRYFAGLEIVFLVVSALFCGIRYWYRLQTVKRQIRDYMQGMQALSDTEDALEEVYMDALEQLQNKRQEEKGAYRNQQREMEEYYALWVHQIKTPISAMRLLLQREEQKQTEDEKWLEFVVEQILSNAIKYSGENHAVTIHINRNEADNTCEFVISDQGIGIRKEDLPRIFEKGYTGYNGRADKTSTGIGLYLCREITKKLGHGIMITSEIGKGTDVTIVVERNNLDVRD